MKTCKDCKKEKSLQDFYAKQGNCKGCFTECVRANRLKKIEQYRLYDRERQIYNFKRITLHRYSNMKLRVEGKATRKYKVEGTAILSKEEFLNWCAETRNQYDILFRNWAEGAFSRSLTPSLDRIDNSKGYVLGNLQWLSMADNVRKDAKGARGPRDNKGKFIKK